MGKGKFEEFEIHPDYSELAHKGVEQRKKAVKEVQEKYRQAHFIDEIHKKGFFEKVVDYFFPPVEDEPVFDIKEVNKDDKGNSSGVTEAIAKDIGKKYGLRVGKGIANQGAHGITSEELDPELILYKLSSWKEVNGETKFRELGKREEVYALKAKLYPLGLAVWHEDANWTPVGIEKIFLNDVYIYEGIGKILKLYNKEEKKYRKLLELTKGKEKAEIVNDSVMDYVDLCFAFGQDPPKKENEQGRSVVDINSPITILRSFAHMVGKEVIQDNLEKRLDELGLDFDENSRVYAYLLRKEREDHS